MTGNLPTRIGILLSGGGRTLQNLIDCIASGSLDAEIGCVISNREAAYGLTRARQADIPTFVEHEPEHIYTLLRQHQIELVCLAGYLRLLPIAEDFEGRVINIHPALLPKFGGKGFHGEHVHHAVLDAKETRSGCSVHYCNNDYDDGPLLLQTEVEVLPEDSVETLAARVFAAECETYPQAIRSWREQHPR